ncbi:MAG: Transcriptional regulator PadR family [Fusobacteria bacterium]|nr:MAG: Transcriptional regulator PadR family [Fusobacteriota bacterium]KAF0228997.1 MAG: Transcriptional regulator PadR [Fusobacteriota bacterium]
MSFNYAILGLLNTKSMTGYDLKKLIQKSSFLYWSGNNNQIYKGLLHLQNKDLVTNEIEHQDGAPSKKIYTITPLGKKELRKWILESPKEPPEFKKDFLIQLACSSDLETDEITTILNQYKESIEMKIIMEQELLRRQEPIPMRNKNVEFIWKMIKKNLISTYENELVWLETVRNGIKN